MDNHPAIAAGRVAVVTGAASGIGRAAAKRFAALGLHVCLADLPGEGLDRAAAEAADAADGKAKLRAVPCDVSRFEDVERLREEAYGTFGEVSLLMNNAGIGNGGGPWEKIDRWRRILEVNLWGVIHGVQVFAPRMIVAG